MSTIKQPSSPQVSKTQDYEQPNQETIYRSLKVQKSTNSIVEQQDESLLMLKKASQINQLSIFNDTLINQNFQVKLNAFEESSKQQTCQATARNETEQQIMPLSEKSCCYCNETENLIQICQCSFAHKICANQNIKAGPLQKQIFCGNCKDFLQLNGVVCFDFSRWKFFKYNLFIETLLVLLIALSLGIFTYYSITSLIKSDQKFIISCLVCLYTLGFILVVCLLTKIITHFKYILFEVKCYHPKNRDYNKKYLSLVMSE